LLWGHRVARPVYFSVCGGGGELPWANLSWYATAAGGGGELANAWRIAPDSINWLTSMHAVDIDSSLAKYAGR
jgi:hypothetical protein